MKRQLVEKLMALQAGKPLGNISRGGKKYAAATGQKEVLKKDPGRIYFNPAEISYLKEHLDLLVVMNLQNVLMWLKENGADFTQTYNKQTLLDIADQHGYVELSSWLKKITVKRTNKSTAIILALKADDLDKLLSAEPHWTDGEVLFQLSYLSVESGKNRVLDYFFKKHPNVFTLSNIFSSGNLPLLKEAIKNKQKYSMYPKICLGEWINAVNNGDNELAAYAVEHHEDIFNKDAWVALLSDKTIQNLAQVAHITVIRKIIEKNPSSLDDLFQNAIIRGNIPLAIELMKAFPMKITFSDNALGHAIRGESQYAALLVGAKLTHEQLKKLSNGWKEILESSMPPKKKILAMATGLSLWLDYAEMEPPHPVLASESPFGFNLETYRAFLPFTHIMCESERNNNNIGLPAKIYLSSDNTIKDIIRGYKNSREKLYAFKLSVLFGNIDEAFKYIDKCAEHDSKQPLHDLCLFELPKNGEWDREGWAKLALSKGTRALQFLPFAPKIERYLKHAPTTIEESENAALAVAYAQARENTELAKFCLNFGVSEKVFNKALQHMHQVRERVDNRLPPFRIEGKDLTDVEGAEKYYFMKLPAQDYKGFFLGELTNNCQSLGKAGEACAIHGMTSKNGGFYVLVRQGDKGKPDKIVAQSWTWISKDNAVVFDSWERLGPSDDKFCEPFLKAAAKKIIEEFDFSGVAIGTRGKTPRTTSFQLLDTPHRPAEGEVDSGYRESREQLEIATNHSLKLLGEITKKLEKLEKSFLEYKKHEKHLRFFEQIKSPGVISGQRDDYFNVVKTALKDEILRNNHKKQLVDYAMESRLLLTGSPQEQDPRQWIKGELQSVMHFHPIKSRR